MKGREFVPDAFCFNRDEAGGTDGVALGNALLGVVRETEVKDIDDIMNALTSLMIVFAAHNGISRADLVTVFAKSVGASVVELIDEPADEPS